ACHKDGDSRGVREGGGDEQSIGDDDELSLSPQLEREVVPRRACIDGHRLSLVDHRSGGTGDRPLALDLESQPQVEPHLRLPLLRRTYATADARDESLLGEHGEIAADGYLRNRKRLRKFRNL